MCPLGNADRLHSSAELARLSRARGVSSVEIARADPTLITELELGSWFNASWRARLLRRSGRRVAGKAVVRGVVARTPLLSAAVSDAAFWSGARLAATDDEWKRLTQSSYAALVYHRFAGEGKPGQERIDIDPLRFAAQLRLLRLLRFRHLAPNEILAFHEGRTLLPRRSFVVTADDGFVDCAQPLADCADLEPQLFVPTQELGGAAHWAGGEQLLDWEGVRALALRGVAIGAHARLHRPLTDLDADLLRDELSGCLADLRDEIAEPLLVLAYPNGRHDDAVIDQTRSAGFVAAYTTEKGRNGVGTDRYCLRRVSVHAGDGLTAIAWKALTGEALPRALLRLRTPVRADEANRQPGSGGAAGTPPLDRTTRCQAAPSARATCS